MKTETYNAIAFLDLEEDCETLTDLGKDIAEAFEKKNYQRLGYLYAQALEDQISKNQTLQSTFYKNAFAAAGVK